MSIPIVFTLVLAVLSLGELFLGEPEEKQPPEKTTEEALGEAIAKLLTEKQEKG